MFILSYLAPRMLKAIYYCKLHSLISIIIILRRLGVVFHPNCLDGFPWGTSCVMLNFYVYEWFIGFKCSELKMQSKLKFNINNFKWAKIYSLIQLGKTSKIQGTIHCNHSKVDMILNSRLVVHPIFVRMTFFLNTTM